jgi:hypothetical protein
MSIQLAPETVLFRRLRPIRQRSQSTCQAAGGADGRATGRGTELGIEVGNAAPREYSTARKAKYYLLLEWSADGRFLTRREVLLSVIIGLPALATLF